MSNIAMTNMEKIQLCQEVVNQIQRESMRPVCRLRLSREPFGIADSHLGGVPYVPHKEQIPVDRDGNQLWLCAQLNFVQMPPIDDFPSAGLLQIFLEDWHFGDFGLEDSPFPPQDYWRVVYYPDIDETVTIEECEAKMAVPWAEAKRSNMPRRANRFDLEDIQKGHDYLWRCPNVPLKVSFQGLEQEGINDEDFRFEELFAAAVKMRLPDADPKEFMPYRLDSDNPQELEALRRIHDQITNGGCKIGGYPNYLQDDPRLYDEGEGWAECDVLLLQLYDDTYQFSQDDIGGMDLELNGGPINFVIRANDLKRHDFSRVLAQWACT